MRVGDKDIRYSTGKSSMFYFKSRGRTFRFCTLLGNAIKTELQAVYVAPHSWREQKLFHAAFESIRNREVGKDAPEFDHFDKSIFYKLPSGVGTPAVQTPGAMWTPPQTPTFCSDITATLHDTVGTITSHRSIIVVS